MSPEESDDTAKESLRRPRRACRKHTDHVVQEQALEELEERKKVLDQRTLKLKEKNKRQVPPCSHAVKAAAH